MKKSILAMAATIAATTLAQMSAVEARGLRIGLGFGVPFARSGIADPSILANADRAKARVDAREREVLAGGRRPATNHSAAREAHRQMAVAAARARAEKHAAAAEADAKRQARVAAAEKVQAAVKVKKSPQFARPAVVLAPATAAATISTGGGDKEIQEAQERQKVKAEALLKSLARPAAPQPGPIEAAPFETGAPVAPAAPQTVRIVPAVAPGAVPAKPVPMAPARPAATEECRRFIPGAGITISVPCTE